MKGKNEDKEERKDVQEGNEGGGSEEQETQIKKKGRRGRE